jgi:hypothetical protein
MVDSMGFAVRRPVSGIVEFRTVFERVPDEVVVLQVLGSRRPGKDLVE